MTPRFPNAAMVVKEKKTGEDCGVWLWLSYGERAVLAEAEMAVVRIKVPATPFRDGQNTTLRKRSDQQTQIIEPKEWHQQPPQEPRED